MITMVGMPGGWELIAIILVIVLLFGAKKLPELARGSGQALRIFKSETKGLKDEDEKAADESATREQRELQAREAGSTDAERTRREHGDGTTA